MCALQTLEKSTTSNKKIRKLIAIGLLLEAISPYAEAQIFTNDWDIRDPALVARRKAHDLVLSAKRARQDGERAVRRATRDTIQAARGISTLGWMEKLERKLEDTGRGLTREIRDTYVDLKRETSLTFIRHCSNLMLQERALPPKKDSLFT